MKTKKTIYYSDPINDDFSGSKFKNVPLPKNYKFYVWRPVYWVFQEFLFYVIVVPIFYLIAKVGWGYKVLGRRKLKKAHIGRKGYFIYGNHTTRADSFLGPIGVCLPRHSFIITSDNVMQHRVLIPLLRMLAAIPLPSYPEQVEPFNECIKKRYRRGNPIIIFPEAHIWPYCTRIRPFPEQSFTYPAQLGAPVFGMCVTYEEHKILKFLKPKAIIHISDPFYPDMSKPLGERVHLLREDVYRYMEDTSSSLDNVEYWRYVYKKKNLNADEKSADN